MSYSIKKINLALSILKDYDGKNIYVKYIKECHDKGYRMLSDFDIEYIIDNKDFGSIKIQKTYKITDWFGERLAEKLKLDFIPEKVHIISIIGMMKDSIHCYIRYRKSVKEPLLIFIPKKAIFGDVFEKDYKNLVVDFSKFNKMTEKFNRKLKPHQEEAVKFLLSRNKAILADEQGLGKEIDEDTVIPTPNGLIKVKELNIGDKIFNRYGEKTKVLGIFKQGIKDIYEIEFNDGTKCNSGLNHLWIAKQKNDEKYKVITLDDIIKSNDVSNYEIPLCKPVKYENYIENIQEYIDFFINNSEINDKFNKIKTSSIKNRIEFIKNILKYDKENDYFIFSAKNYDKIELVSDLLHSLGLNAYIEEKNDLYFLKSLFNIDAYGNISTSDRRFIKKIHKKYKKNAICLKVDSDDGSFLTENYIVTHNTTTTVVSSLAGDFKKILIICPCSLKGTWKRELSFYVPTSDIEVVNGKKWNNSKKYTIINYDILQNFYQIPQEIEYEVTVDENGKKVKRPVLVKSKGKYVEKYKKSINKTIINECLSKSRLYLENFDLVIIDEVQKLANNTSIRYKILDDFLKRSKPKSIYCVTGTPLTNRPLNLYHILKLINADIVKDYNYYMERFCDASKINKKDGTVIVTKKGASNLDELREKIKGLYIRRLQKDIPGIVKKTIFTRYYTLNEEENIEYGKLWNDYLKSQNIESNSDIEKYKDLIEGSLVRQFLADKMVKNTIDLANEFIEDGEKVMIVCCFENEVKKFKEYYKDKAVVYDGKKTIKQKDKAEYSFMNDPSKKVFIGQIIASGVGLTLTASHICIFNSFSWVPSDNWQVMDRVHRLSQTKDVSVYYQLFDDENSLNMWNKIINKESIIKEVIKSENEK